MYEVGPVNCKVCNAFNIFYRRRDWTLSLTTSLCSIGWYFFVCDRRITNKPNFLVSPGGQWRTWLPVHLAPTPRANSTWFYRKHCFSGFHKLALCSSLVNLSVSTSPLCHSNNDYDSPRVGIRAIIRLTNINQLRM